MKSAHRAWSAGRIAVAGLLFLLAPARAVEIEAPGEQPAAELPSQSQSPASPLVSTSVSLDASAPSLSPAPALEAAAAAAAAVPEAARSPRPQAPAESARAQVLEALAPQNASHLSDAQAKELAAEVLEPSSGRSEALAETVVAGPGVFPGPVFSRPELARERARAEPAPPAAVRAARRLREVVADRLAFARIWAHHLQFYLVTNIVNKWGAYQRDRNAAVAKGVTPAVSSPRAFFGHMRVMGQTGRFYILGYASRDNQSVMNEARESFRRYFDAPGIGPREYESFERFMRRALTYNAEKRARSNFVKRLRDKMLEASLLPADQIASFFDARVKDDTYIKDFQRDGANGVLDDFRGKALDLLLKEPAQARGKVLGVLLIGSFANGGATPGSDFDVSLITEDGSSERAQPFMDAFIAAWGPMQKIHTVTFHETPLRPSRWLVDAIHDCKYLVISPDKALVEALQRKPDEKPKFWPAYQLTARGRVDRVLQYLAVETTMLFTRPAPPKK